MEMEVETVREKVGKIGSIVPPRLEDAGLENCALSVQGIREAFTRAADAVRSQASSIFDGDEDEGGCIEGSGPCNGEWADSLLDDPHSPYGSQGCLGSRVGGLLEESKDKVVSVGDEGLEDKVMDAHISEPHLGEEGESCVAGLEGLPIPPVRQDGDEDDEDGFPVLTETAACMNLDAKGAYLGEFLPCTVMHIASGPHIWAVADVLRFQTFTVLCNIIQRV